MTRPQSTPSDSVCELCGDHFKRVRHTTGRFCSPQCFRAWKRAQFVTRFWAKVDRSAGPLACWLWLAYRNHFGYGMIGFIHADGKHRATRAHRVAYELRYGPIPDGMLVMHSCDNPGCVNPAHLSLGSHADNMRDCGAKGRLPSGEQHPARLHPERVACGEATSQAKLTDAQVLAIRQAVAAGTPQKDLARAYGVSRTAVCLIVSRKTWAHV